MNRPPATSRDTLLAILNGIKFKPSCVNLKWEWEIVPVWNGGALVQYGLDSIRFLAKAEPPAECGWLVSTTFERPDINTGVVSRGRGRQEFIRNGTEESGVVKTCWVLAEMIVKHEIMEAFTYDDITIFNPHNTVEELSIPERIRRGRISTFPIRTDLFKEPRK
jgi:hypothetical protein